MVHSSIMIHPLSTNLTARPSATSFPFISVGHKDHDTSLSGGEGESRRGQPFCDARSHRWGSATCGHRSCPMLSRAGASAHFHRREINRLACRRLVPIQIFILSFLRFFRSPPTPRVPEAVLSFDPSYLPSPRTSPSTAHSNHSS